MDASARKEPLVSSFDTLNTPVINLPEIDNATFVGNVHVAGALAAFVAFEVLLFLATGIAAACEEFFLGRRRRPLAAAHGRRDDASSGSQRTLLPTWANPSRQYVGLFGYAFGQALIFAPFLSYVFDYGGGGATVAQAAIITGIGFAILTGIGLFTRKDLSFLRPIVMWGFGLALLAIVFSAFAGPGLGTWFSIAMIGLSVQRSCTRPRASFVSTRRTPTSSLRWRSSAR